MRNKILSLLKKKRDINYFILIGNIYILILNVLKTFQ